MSEISEKSGSFKMLIAEIHDDIHKAIWSVRSEKDATEKDWEENGIE